MILFSILISGIESSLTGAAQVCTCTRPGPPIELNFKPTDTTIEVTWAAPLTNKAYTDFDFQEPDGTQSEFYFKFFKP